jgi:hypothetical protein
MSSNAYSKSSDTQGKGTTMTSIGPAKQALTDQRDVWEERLRRVRRSQARTDLAGMRRPPRDPDERAFLAARGLLGPFQEDRDLPSPAVARQRRPR